MRNSIIVNVSELRALIQDVRRTGKEYVEVSISDSFEDDGEMYPSSLSLCACSTEECIEFEPIYPPENETALAEAMMNAVHMSSNLL